MRILIVEDDAMIGQSLVRGLTDDGYAVDWVRDGAHAEIALQDRFNEFHIAILDWNLPQMSGIQVLRQIRRAGNNIPVLIVTARDGLEDRVEGLDQGADDFLVKPFDLAELKARIRALARRHVGRLEPQLKTASLTLEPGLRTVIKKGRHIRLTAREYTLLYVLMERPGKLFSRAQLEARVYDYSSPVESNAIEYLIYSLRHKIGNEQIANVRGIGWCVVKEEVDEK